MEIRRDKPRDMRHVHDEIRTDGFRDLREPLEIDNPRVSRGARYYHARLMLLRELFELVIIDTVSNRVNAVRHDIVIRAGDVDRAAVGQMPALA